MRTTRSKATSKEELATLSALPDDQIDLSDAPELSGLQWKNAIRGKFYRPVKQQLTIRLDADVLDWLKRQNGGKGYQSRLNRILREAMMTSIEDRAGKKLSR